MSKTEFQADLLQAAEARLPDDALRSVRQSHLAEAAARGFPTTRDENWRYNNLASAIELSNSWLRAVLDDGARGRTESPLALPDIDAYGLVLVDGLVDEVALRQVQDAVGDKLQISRLRDAAGSVAADGPLDALNAAMLQDGIHLKVRAGAQLDKPLAIFLHDGAVAASHSRIVIEVEDNASIDIVEYHLAGHTSQHFANTVTQLTLAPAARANLVRVQKRAHEHVQISKLSVRLLRDSRLMHAAFDLGGGLVRNDIVVDIAEPGADVQLDGLYLADGEQHIDNHTRVDHRVGPATSREEYRGILHGRSRCVFNGKAIVHKGADGTDAQQANHNLLLSDKAEIDTKPELEIYADDVKCAHGATVGELDQSAMFYMQSRGLDREQAAHMLTRAFAAQVLSRLPIDALHAHLEPLIDARLDDLLEEHEA